MAWPEAIRTLYDDVVEDGSEAAVEQLFELVRTPPSPSGDLSESLAASDALLEIGGEEIQQTVHRQIHHLALKGQALLETLVEALHQPGLSDLDRRHNEIVIGQLLPHVSAK